MGAPRRPWAGGHSPGWGWGGEDGLKAGIETFLFPRKLLSGTDLAHTVHWQALIYGKDPFKLETPNVVSYSENGPSGTLSGLHL